VLPAYTFLLGLIALLGYMTIAAGIVPKNPNYAVPDLFIHFFPSWFTGVAFSAIAIGALVPAAIMSIAAANLFTRNIYKEFFRPQATDREEASAAKIVSLVVKLGALGFVIFLPTKYAIDLQLLGGVWILQTLPSIVIGLYTRWLNRWALLAGWAVGMGIGTWMAADQTFKSSVYALNLFGVKFSAYEGVFAVVANLIVATLVTLVLAPAGPRGDADETADEDYFELSAEVAHPTVGVAH
jgi:solute:Na+ symporter, SSS family